MLHIDKADTRPVHEQLVAQLRYQIANGHYKVNELLPSTRALGKQLGISFHTVRKAYQQLEQEGHVRAQVGSGYLVQERRTTNKAVVMERGAALLQDAIQHLIGLGLSESDVDYLFQEQMAQVESDRIRHKLLFAAAYREMAEAGANQIQLLLQQRVDPVTLAVLPNHQDADYVFTPLPLARSVRDLLPRVDVVSVYSYLDPSALRRIGRLFDQESLCLVTRDAEAIPPLMQEVRAATGFGGQILAAPLAQGTESLKSLVAQSDLVVFLPACRRRLRSLIKDEQASTVLTHVISKESLQAIQEVVPT